MFRLPPISRALFVLARPVLLFLLSLPLAFPAGAQSVSKGAIQVGPYTGTGGASGCANGDTSVWNGSGWDCAALALSTSFYKLDGSQNPTASQPMTGTSAQTATNPPSTWQNGYKFTGLAAPTLGSADPVRATDLTPVIPGGWPPAGFSLQPTGGSLNAVVTKVHPDGMWYIDRMALFGGNLGGFRDDDGTYGNNKWDSVNWPDATTTYTLSQNIGQWSYNVASAFPVGAQSQFCRHDGTPDTAACSDNNGHCVSTIENTNHSQLIVVEHSATIASGICTGAGTPYDICVDSTHAYRYYPIAVDASTCTGLAAWNYQGEGGPSAALTSGDKFMSFQLNSIHPTKFGSRLLAQQTAEAKQEDSFYGGTNMVPNGNMESDCTNNANGWHLASNFATAACSVWGSFTGTTYGGGSQNTIYGRGAIMNAGHAAGDGFITDAITVMPNTWYQVQFYYQSNDLTAGASAYFDVVDGASAAPGTSITAATGASNDIDGWAYYGDYVPLTKLTADTSGGNRVPGTTPNASPVYPSYQWLKYVVKFYSRGYSTVRLKMAYNGAGTGAMKLDNVWMQPALTQSAGLFPLWPSGTQRWTLEGDSIAGYPNVYYLPEALDAAFGVWRSDMLLQKTFLTSTASMSGIQMTTLEDENWPFTTSNKPTFGLLEAGVNDLSPGATGDCSTFTGQVQGTNPTGFGTTCNGRSYKDSTGPGAGWTSDQLETYLAASATDVRKVGTIPVYFGMPPNRGDTTATNVCGGDGAVTCGVKQNNVLNKLLKNGHLN